MMIFRHPKYYAELRKRRRELTSHKLPALGQGFKLQARVNKLKNLMTRVQAHKPMFRGTSNKNKGIAWMLHVKTNLVW